MSDQVTVDSPSRICVASPLLLKLHSPVFSSQAHSCRLRMLRRPAAAPLRRPAAAAPPAQRAAAAPPAEGEAGSDGAEAEGDQSPRLAEEPTGPQEAAGRDGSARQYCWWITFPFPYAVTVVRLQLKTPAEYTRQSFLDEVKRAYERVGVPILEAVVFLEKHRRRGADGERLPHLNVLAKTADQRAWSPVAKALFENARVRVDFSKNMKTWYDGIVYGRVSSDHEPEE